MKIVLDSNVVIAGLISPKGAGNGLLTNFLPHKKIEVVTTGKQSRRSSESVRQAGFCSEAK